MIRHDGGHGAGIQGPVTIDTVVTVMAQVATIAGEQDELVIDLSGITEVDSSAVSMLLEWQRQAGKKQQQLHFINVPQSLRSLIQLYGVSALISSA